MNSGYEQTMKYFRDILPLKKERLDKVYSLALKYLKNANKGLKANNVEEVQWWFGDLFILLCENKEIIDKDIYDKIVRLKNLLMDSSSKFLIFYTKFNDRRDLEKAMQEVINLVDERASDVKLFLQNQL